MIYLILRRTKRVIGVITEQKCVIYFPESWFHAIRLPLDLLFLRWAMRGNQ